MVKKQHRGKRIFKKDATHLKKEGYAIIEMPQPLKKSTRIGGDKLILKKNNIVRWFINEKEERPAYNQSKKTLRKLMNELNVKKFKIFVNSFGGRDRLFLQFWK